MGLSLGSITNSLPCREARTHVRSGTSSPADLVRLTGEEVGLRDGQGKLRGDRERTKKQEKEDDLSAFLYHRNVLIVIVPSQGEHQESEDQRNKGEYTHRRSHLDLSQSGSGESSESGDGSSELHCSDDTVDSR
jgi:hypothetical protein